MRSATVSERERWPVDTWYGFRVVLTSTWRLGCSPPSPSRSAVWLLVILALLARTFTTTDARADDSIRIALLAVRPLDAPLADELELDLRSLGFEVVSVDASLDTSSSAALQATAAHLGARALITVVDAPGTRRIEVGVVDPATGNVVRSEIHVSRNDSARVVTLRVTEVVRASFRALQRKPPPEFTPRDEVHVSASPSTAHRRGRLALALGVGGAASPGGVRLTPALVGELRVNLGQRTSAGLHATWPAGAAEVTAPEGDAEVRPGLAALRLSATPLARGAVLRPELGLRVGLAFAQMSGNAAPPFRSADDVALSPAGAVDAALQLALTGALAARAEFALGATTAPLRTRFAGREAARWGQPFVLTGLMLEISGP